MEIFNSKEEYIEFKKNWCEFYNNKNSRSQLGPIHFALYAILRNKDWRKCFAHNTDKNLITRLEYTLTKGKIYSNILLPFKDISEDTIIAIRENGIAKWSEKESSNE